MVGGWIAERSRDEVVEEFAEAGAAVAPVYAPSELLNDPQVQAMDMITTVDDPDLGPLRMQNVMWRMSQTPGEVRFTGRRIGADTRAVLCDELGLSAEELEQLRQRGVAA
jgi:crotonobetainyl-CoA:carnitine CoA-transferase CaiB-like acyl-CoA transferase